MEKKKLLLVAISVGVFLVIVIGASLLVFSPGGAVTAAARRPIPPGSPGVSPVAPAQNQSVPADPAGLAQNPDDLPALPSSPAPVGAAVPAADDTLRQFGVPQNTENGENRVVITVSRPSTAAVNESAPPPPKQPRSDAAAKSSPPRTTTVAKAQPKPAQKPAAAPKPKTYDAFWVQAGSFSVRNRADTVRETLASKGIASIIENRDVNGKTWYRVRVGPYVSQNEADYWLSLIKLIEGFEGSQVWKSRVRQ
ncbi:MAG: SPOR domain-containing protein [Spirochaetaceae bacterium]|jgi:DedD protein|nr:SPOR domain-containing protein [Spirochaetaceae bacterium]